MGGLEQSGKYDSAFAAHAQVLLLVAEGHLTQFDDVFRGSTKETRGTAYVVYEDIYDAKTAVEHLSGFNVANRYLIVLYYNHQKHSKKVGLPVFHNGHSGHSHGLHSLCTFCFDVVP